MTFKVKENATMGEIENAIEKNEDGTAKIDFSKCISFAQLNFFTMS